MNQKVYLILVCTMMSLLCGCSKGKNNDLTGVWKDISVDKVAKFSPEQRERLRMTMILKPGGVGDLRLTGANGPFRWAEKDGKVEITMKNPGGRPDQTLPMTLSSDRRTMTFAGSMELKKQ
ncbi:hypothetical protein [Armatimonas sp.]|uniref:hypothetical protein n=1 Tax=Armatimonas sp. TaxID=1872638 RepID=UPI00286A42FB|nr:hypothetical protein [Armatimonas sp.]